MSKFFISEKSNNAFYYGECRLISGDIFEIIKDMIKARIDKIKWVKCIFDKGEIIILIKDGIDEVINVGNLEGRNSLKIKYIIQKESKNLELSDIFSEFKYSGYDLINKYLPYGYISYKNIEAKIYSLLKQNNIIEKKPLKLDISNLTTINFKKAYIVKKDIINKLKRIYNINEVITYLNNHHQLNEINYKNLETNYQNLSKFLNENQINYINNIKQIENKANIKFNENEGTLVIKILNNKSNLKYIDDLDITDRDFAEFLSRTFNNSINFYKVFYLKVENKLFLIIHCNPKYIYEIANLNNDDIITVEYLIEIVNSLSDDIDSLNDYIGNSLLNIGIKKMISYGNPVNIGNNLIINLYEIRNNNKLRNSMKNMKVRKFEEY